MYIGLDIGGTYIRGVLIGKNSRKPLVAKKWHTPRDKRRFFKALKNVIAELSIRGAIKTIGVGLPGMVRKNGVLAEASHLPFLHNWNAKKFFARFAQNVAVENDARCFTLAEARLGAGRTYKTVVGITIGTGIGGGVIVNGLPYRGAHDSAGEVGHTVLQVGRKWSGKNRKTLETFEQMAAKRAFQRHGDRSKIIGIGIANIVNTLDPEIIILGGGAVHLGNVKLPLVRKIAKPLIQSPLAKRMPIVKGTLGEYAGAIGAALLNKKFTKSRVVDEI